MFVNMYFQNMSKKNLFEENLKKYDALVELCNGIERKGKSVPYTSDNGYMFSFINKEGELGIRLSKEDQESFKEKYSTTIFKSHGSVMKDYVLVPNKMLDDPENLSQYLFKSQKFVKSLKPK